MVRTRVGYSGGSTQNPTYENLANHTESFEVDFDPSVISYEKLLDIFWGSHNPCHGSYSQQYKAVIFYHNDEQKKQALAAKAKTVAKLNSGAITTEILPLKKFWLAEDYHQKYYLRHNRAMMSVLNGLYPQEQDFVNSTAAARLNGILGSYGKNTLASELKALKLPEDAVTKLIEAAARE